MLHRLLPVFALAAAAVVVPSPAVAQSPDLLLPPQASSAASRRDVPALRARKARVHLPALESAAIRLHLFDDVQPTLTRTSLQRPAADRLVWVGRDASGAQAVLTVARGVLTGTVFTDNRVFEVTLEPDGQYAVAELDPGAFPTDDPPFDDVQFEVLQAPDGQLAEGTTAPALVTAAEVADGTPVQIDVMIVWTPRAESAAGGAAAMQSLAMNAVANANLAYTNSLVNARLNLVYDGRVEFVETPSNISGDLGALRGTTDGQIDHVHTLRTQYGADVVSLIGDGYRAAGSCGIGSLMSTVSTSFAGYAFNVVDRTCAVGNLSYAHEVGHNQGLHHDPSNAGSTPSYSYAYGYQDPGGYFRTVLSYGSATRVAYLSNPAVSYNGRATGTASQDNARALNANAGTVAAFRSAPGGTTTEPTPGTTCTYSVSTTSLSFAASGGSKTVSVTAPAGCAWSAANDSGSSWVVLSTGSGTGNGAVTVTTTSNGGSARSTSITVAGRTVGISQQGVKARGKK